jgi:predicted DNA-binding ribbon-helix-helix protein
MQIDVWNARREELAQAVRVAVLDLLSHQDDKSTLVELAIPLEGDAQAFVAVGTADDIRTQLAPL